MEKLPRVQIKYLSGFNTSLSLIETIKNKHLYWNINPSLIGEAPKELVHIYEYGRANKKNRQRWPKYIAKVGHKLYANESITEQLFTRIGETAGFNVAESKLLVFSGQLRFLSKYFLKKNQRLMHGAEIFMAHLEDREFVNEIHQKREESVHFTFQYVCQAIQSYFPSNCEEIIADYIKMLAFDALLGNNDRHHWNWGVVVDVRNERLPYFSPIYDSARGLFWNLPERRLKNIERNKAENQFMEKYCGQSRPQLGWDSNQPNNHFELLQLILEKYPEYAIVIDHYAEESVLNACFEVLDQEFGNLMSERRQSFIRKYLVLRFSKYNEVVKGV